MTDTLMTSPSLIERLHHKSDTDAWQKFMKLYGPLMIRWNKDYGLQPADASDVAQEISIYVFNNIHRFVHRHPGSFRAWLRAIAYNKIRRHKDSCFKHKLDNVDNSDVEDKNHELKWAPDYCQSLLNRAIDIIRPDFRATSWAAFEGVYFDGEDPSDVGKRLGLSRNAVYIAHSRILGKLKATLHGLLDDEAI